METKRTENKLSYDIDKKLGSRGDHDDFDSSDKKSSNSDTKSSSNFKSDSDHMIDTDDNNTYNSDKKYADTRKFNDPMTKLSTGGGTGGVPRGTITGATAAFTRKTNEKKFTGHGGFGGSGVVNGPSSPTDSMLSPCTKKLRRKQSKKLSSSDTSLISLEFWVPPDNISLILGSSSPSRGQILVDLGWNFQIMKPNIDESAIHCDDPFRLPILIAKEKAIAILNQLQPLLDKTTGGAHSSSGALTAVPQSMVILTCDQIVLYRNEIRHKPLSRAQAHEFLSSYQANEIVQTISAVVATHYPSGKQASEIDIATIYWNGISEEVIEEKLLDKEEIYSSCGAFLIEDPDFLACVNRIEGDLDSIRGMPIKATKKVFRTVISTDI
jgi:septum formation protein